MNLNLFVDFSCSSHCKHALENLKYCRSEFILLTDPERESRELNWLKRAAIEIEASVEISGVSEYLASLAIVGPKSREVSSLFFR